MVHKSILETWESIILCSIAVRDVALVRGVVPIHSCDGYDEDVVKDNLLSMHQFLKVVIEGV